MRWNDDLFGLCSLEGGAGAPRTLEKRATGDGGPRASSITDIKGPLWLVGPGSIESR